MLDTTTMQRLLRGAALAGALALPALPAQAAIYSSAFDPVDFFGVATFDVDDACLTSDGTKPNDGAPCSVTWLSATVTITDAPSTTFSFPQLPSPTAVVDILVSGGELAGVDSSIIGPASGDPGANQGPWFLQYQSGGGEFGLGRVLLFPSVCFSEGESVVCLPNTNPDAVSTADVENFTRVSAVPEPATLALMLGGLGVGWWARRRKA